LLSAKQVTPGKTGEIEITVKTDGLTAINKIVTVSTNDPRQPSVQLTLAGMVEPEFALSERNIYFGSNPKGKQVVKELLITVHPQRDSKIVGASTDDANVTVTLEPVAGSGGKKYRLVAVQKPETKEGYHFGTILLKTTSARSPEVRLSVRGMVTAGQ
jgi:hypothetical protein